jgi:gluconate 2-dehydrogenase gamma chain
VLANDFPAPTVHRRAESIHIHPQARGLPLLRNAARDDTMDRYSRRIFLKATGAAALVPTAVDAQRTTTNGQQQRADSPSAARDAAPPYRFLQAPEAAFIEAAVVRLIPPDELGPSALEAGVPTYIDQQLAGAWGAGERLYRAGPWQPGKPTQGYQLPFTPAELFRNAMRGIRSDLERTRQTAFEKLSGSDQDAYLTRLQTGHQDLENVPSNVFFESLLAMTIEGYFCDPVYGGNKDMAAWRMIGFPGAYANYYHLVDQYGIAFTQPPTSLAQNGRGQVHIHPDIPATAPVVDHRKGH